MDIDSFADSLNHKAAVLIIITFSLGLVSIFVGLILMFLRQYGVLLRGEKLIKILVRVSGIGIFGTPIIMYILYILGFLDKLGLTEK